FGGPSLCRRPGPRPLLLPRPATPPRKAPRLLAESAPPPVSRSGTPRTPSPPRNRGGPARESSGRKTLPSRAVSSPERSSPANRRRAPCGNPRVERALHSLPSQEYSEVFQRRSSCSFLSAPLEDRSDPVSSVAVPQERDALRAR